MVRKVWTEAEKRKRKKKICIRPFCRKRSVEKPVCARCCRREYAKKYPLKYKFDNLRTHAKTRGIPFRLTYEEFEHIAYESGYDQNSGRTKDKLHVDRIEASKGYIASNIQVLTSSANSRKGSYERGRELEDDVP